MLCGERNQTVIIPGDGGKFRHEERATVRKREKILWGRSLFSR